MRLMECTLLLEHHQNLWLLSVLVYDIPVADEIYSVDLQVDTGTSFFDGLFMLPVLNSILFRILESFE